ncbi:MAG: hypothetical protein Q7T63_10950 [Burkholderiaceae bacterium]|nr:hypothetical protein [Burkholderiaceae bacterium]MDO9089886.1 hypothetical protein [Burkholderiaceae bacterium]
MNKLMIALILAAASAAAVAKLPAPVLSDEAKAKAAEAAARTAWSGKVDAFLLCKSQDKVAASYYKTAKASGTPTKPAAALPACADPGPFVYNPGGTAAPATAAMTGAAKPAPAAPAAVKSAKKG